jgi:hypothetical protein
MLAFFVVCHTMANPLHRVDAVDNCLVAHQQRQQQKQQATHHGALVIIMRLSSSKSAMATFVWCFTEALLSLLQQQQKDWSFSLTAPHPAFALAFSSGAAVSQAAVQSHMTQLLSSYFLRTACILVLSIVSLIQRWQFNSIQFNSIVSV